MKKFNLFLISTLLVLPALSVHAQGVDILWQGETYTPPFYKGKSLWSTQSRVTLVAIPQGFGSLKNLTYKWIKNGTTLGNVSGVGKSSLSFTDSIISRPQTIEVKILSNQGSELAQASVFIAPVSTTIVVYEKNPLYGFLFHKEVGSVYKFQNKEITFTTFPFFFSISGREDDNLGYRWLPVVTEGVVRSSITYRVQENAVGSSQISVVASNIAKITQRASKSFVVQFGK